MKKVKISIAVIVLLAIGAAILFGIQSVDPPPPPTPVDTQFITQIEKEIQQLKEKPNNKFCKDYYKEVLFHIDEFSKPAPPKYPYGRFGKTQSDNKHWKEILEKNLYSAYTQKFIKQSKVVLNGSEWKSDDLKFIQNEINTLSKSKLFVQGGAIANEFKTIQTALNKYNEIVSFIASCKSFSFLGTSIDKDRFPVTEVQSKISRAASFRQNSLGNEYVNNCTRLHEQLKEIPQQLFNKHVDYLDNKINDWSDMYCNYGGGFKDYSQTLYTPLRNEINDLGNSTMYRGVNTDTEYRRLLEKWKADNLRAYNTKYPCN